MVLKFDSTQQTKVIIYSYFSDLYQANILKQVKESWWLKVEMSVKQKVLTV